jgi:hypothetical protein
LPVLLPSSFIPAYWLMGKNVESWIA